MRKDIKSMYLCEIEDELEGLGEAKYRAKQIFRRLSQGAKSFGEMTELSIRLREKLESQFYVDCPEIVSKQVSSIDGTVKYLWRLHDANCVESVLMRYEHGNTVCVSSQAGCRMGCAFCASAHGGFVRNLAASEILSQVIFTARDLNIKISNVVLMGIGEPLDNFDNVIRFFALINDKDGLNIGMRHISLSTCGLTERIDKLATYNLQLTLSVSLHAADDETRNKLMPVNRASDIKTLIASCKRYFEKTGRRITFEYILIEGLNDSRSQAEKLAALMKEVSGHVNLIPLNRTDEGIYKPGNIKAFAALLGTLGVNVTARRRLGADINAACGQLRLQAQTDSCGVSRGEV